MTNGGWARDPAGRHEARFYEDGTWTDYVSDAAQVTKDPLPPSPSPPLNTPRRRGPRRWIVAGLIGAFALLVVSVGGFLLFGLGLAIDELDTYKADLTSGDGDFPSSVDAEQVREYTPDGYRMASLTPNQVIFTGVEAPTSHSVLSVRVDITGERVPAASSIGPLCLGGPSETRDPDQMLGFALGLSGGGRVTLSSFNRGTFKALGDARARPLKAGDSVVLELVCGSFLGRTTVTGYVDGERLVSAKLTAPTDTYSLTGVVARTTAPAAWLLTSFERLGPNDIPPDWQAAR